MQMRSIWKVFKYQNQRRYLALYLNAISKVFVIILCAAPRSVILNIIFVPHNYHQFCTLFIHNNGFCRNRPTQRKSSYDAHDVLLDSSSV